MVTLALKKYQRSCTCLAIKPQTDLNVLQALLTAEDSFSGGSNKVPEPAADNNWSFTCFSWNFLVAWLILTPNPLFLPRLLATAANNDSDSPANPSYKSLCSELGVKLAEDFPMNDKAFTCQKRGKVRGLMLDATDLAWRLTDSKVNKAKGSVESALSKEASSLKEWQWAAWMTFHRCALSWESSDNPSTAA